LESDPYFRLRLVKALDRFALIARSMPRGGTSFSLAEESEGNCFRVPLAAKSTRKH